MLNEEREPILAHWETDNGKGVVLGGLHMIEANRRPYFSLTCWYRGKEGSYAGAAHDEILRQCPQFADLAALHLSDIDGVPMHALENGFYHLGGTHWERPKYAVAAKHFRITEDEARQLVRDLFGDHFSTTAGFLTKTAAIAAKVRLAEWIEAQRPRWKREAEACIAHHNLRIYGDAYNG